MPQIFEVGGCVRDRILGIESNDIDFSFVLDNTRMSVDEGFQSMNDWLPLGPNFLREPFQKALSQIL